jgi:hypothetical protein
MRARFPMILACLAASLAGPGYPGDHLPEWQADPGTTLTLFRFSGASLLPEPELEENPFGGCAAAVELGPFASGWQDPADPFALAGLDDDGAWDLGAGGLVSLWLDLAPPLSEPGSYYRVDLFVRAVSYLGISALPGLVLSGHPDAGLTLATGLLAADPLFPGASWNYQIWTTTLGTVSAPHLAIELRAPANGSVVDSLRVQTRHTLVAGPYGSSGAKITALRPTTAPGVFELEFLAVPGLAFVVEESADLSGWSPAGRVESSGETNRITVAAPPGARRTFWRLALDPGTTPDP